MSPIASSATATLFLPGQLLTKMPRSLAAATSIVSYPAPARTMSASRAPASIVARVTFVLRTTRMPASPMRAGSSSAVHFGLKTTSSPRAVRSSSDFGEISSAM